LLVPELGNRSSAAASHRGLEQSLEDWLAEDFPWAGRTKVKRDQTNGWHRASLRDVDDVRWQKLANRKIYFGHQSVGTDIVNGIRDIQREYPQVRLNIVRSSNPSGVTGSAFVESTVGKNGDARSKTANFLTVLEEGIGSAGGIAMYKYCFADVNLDTDIPGMFDAYKVAAESVRVRYPRVILVHITMPLTRAERLLKSFAKSLLRRPSARALELKRNQFNDLLRKEYSGKEPIFDLAAVESTRSDGSRTFFRRDGIAVYTLAPEFTNDGGHLNEFGRRRAAEELLITLARL